jgi:hypothetical protein
LGTAVVSMGCSAIAHAQQTESGPPNAPATTAPVAVRVSLRECSGVAPLDSDAFLAILTAELRADGVDQVLVGLKTTARDEAGGLAWIDLTAASCEPSAPEIDVSIEDAATNKRVARRIALGDVAAPARARALALAVAELLRASWLELSVPDAPPSQIAVPPAVREAVVRRVAAAVPTTMPSAAASGAESLRVERRTGISVAGAWRAFPSTYTAMYGGRAGVSFPFLTRSLLLRLDGGALFGAARDVLGDVTIGLAGAGGAVLFASPRDATLAIAAGPRVEAGLAWASGSSAVVTTSSSTGSGFVASASLLTTVSLRVAVAWRLVFELEGGAVVSPFEARADVRRVSGIEGAMLGMALGLTQWR